MKTDRTRRLLVMLSGLTIMGVGIALFKVSLMGNDPHSAMVMTLADWADIDYSIMLMLVNSLWFILEFSFGKSYIGIGTFANWFGVGIVASACIKWMEHSFTVPSSMLPRTAILLAGILILALAASLYQTADLGIAPYDVLSILLSKKYALPYFWCRIFTDSVCAAATFLMGGLLGPGSLICAIGLGIFIAFFNQHISEKLLEKPYQSHAF